MEASRKVSYAEGSGSITDYCWLVVNSTVVYQSSGISINRPICVISCSAVNDKLSSSFSRLECGPGTSLGGTSHRSKAC